MNCICGVLTRMSFLWFDKFIKLSLISLFIGFVCLNYESLSVPVLSNRENELRPSTVEYLDKICNSPASIAVREEGATLSTFNHAFKLEKVIVIFRHGDRGPLRPVQNITDINCARSRFGDDNCFDDPITSIFLDKVVKLDKTQFTHSDVDPEELFDFPRTTECKPGMLSSVGLSQHIRLGGMIGRAYHTKLGFNTANLKRQIRINVTPYPRTFQSSIAFLYGFSLSLDPNVLDNLPDVHFSKEHAFFCGLDKNEMEDFCHTKCSRRMRSYRREMALENIFEPAKLYELRKLHKSLESVLLPAEEDATHYSNFNHVLDAMNLFYCHAVPLPDRISAKQIDELVVHVKTILKLTSKTSSFRKASLLKSYGLLVDLFKAMSSERLDHRVEFYSGHDITLEALNGVFGFSHEPTVPSYASRLVLEVYRQPTNGHKYIKFIYNGDDLTANVNSRILQKLSARNFIGRLSLEEAQYDLLSIERAQKYISSELLTHFSALHFTAACGTAGDTLYEREKVKNQDNNNQVSSVVVSKLDSRQ